MGMRDDELLDELNSVRDALTKSARELAGLQSKLEKLSWRIRHRLGEVPFDIGQRVIVKSSFSGTASIKPGDEVVVMQYHGIAHVVIYNEALQTATGAYVTDLEALKADG